MTAGLSPAGTLRAAAEKIREHAGKATPGPWSISRVPPFTDPLLMSRSEETPEDGDVLIAGSIDVGEPDRRWIAMMHPGVGVAFGGWLERAAVKQLATERAAGLTWPGPDDAQARDGWVAEMTDQRALAVARAVLGEGAGS